MHVSRADHPDDGGFPLCSILIEHAVQPAAPLMALVGNYLAGGVVGLASIAAPAFVLPVSIWPGVFYGTAGLGHVVRRERSDKENVATVTDSFAFAVPAAIVASSLWKTYGRERRKA